MAARYWPIYTTRHSRTTVSYLMSEHLSDAILLPYVQTVFGASFLISSRWLCGYAICHLISYRLPHQMKNSICWIIFSRQIAFDVTSKLTHCHNNAFGPTLSYGLVVYLGNMAKMDISYYLNNICTTRSICCARNTTISV